MKVRLEVAPSLEDEGGNNRGEQTGLYTSGNSINAVADTDAKPSTHEDQGGVQVLVVLLYKVAVILVGFALEFVAEFDASVARGSKEVRKERW